MYLIICNVQLTTCNRYCDAVKNCKMSTSPPVLVDHTPPPDSVTYPYVWPMRSRYDLSLTKRQYFLNSDMVNPGWETFLSTPTHWDQPTDPESGKLQQRACSL